MILGYEDPVQMPTMDIYSTDLMKTYIAGVKDLYDKGQEEYKDFMKAYQNFYSPVPGANEEYYNATIGGAQKLIQQLQDQGIDPFKSREGRAAIRNYIYGVPVGRLNEMKNEAEAAQEYIKSRDKLISEGKFDPLTDAVLGGGSLENWNRSKGPWTRRYAIENKSLGDLTSTFYDKLQKDERLGPDTSRGKDAGFYDLWGVSENTLQTADAAALEALKQTPYYQLFRQKASGYVDNEGNPIDPDQVLLQQIRHTNEKYWAQPESKRNEMAVDRWKEARSDARARSSSSSGNGSGDKQNPNGFSYFNDIQNELVQKMFKGSGSQINRYSDIIYRQLRMLGYANSDLSSNKQGQLIVNPRISQIDLSKFTTTDYSEPYMNYMKAQGNVVDSNNLYTPEQVKERVYGSSYRAPKEARVIPTGSTIFEITPKSTITGYVRQDGIFELMKPVVVTYNTGTEAAPKLQKVTRYQHIPEADVDNFQWVNPTGYKTADSQASSGVGTKNTKMLNYSQVE